MQTQAKLQVAHAPMSGVKLDSFYQTPTWMTVRAIRAKLTAADLYLWMYLQMLDPLGEVLVDLPKLKDIALAIGVSERQVKWSIAKLEKEGLYHYQVDPWKGQNLSGLEAKKLGEPHQVNNPDSEEIAKLASEEFGDRLTTLSPVETIEALPEGISSDYEQYPDIGTLSKIEAAESWLAGRGEIPPWRVKHGVNGINLEFTEWLRSKQMQKFKEEISLSDTLGWIANREPGGKYFASHSQLVAEVIEWQHFRLEEDVPTPGQLLASEVAIALNSEQPGTVVDRFKKTAGKYDWEIAPGEPVPQILEWYVKKIQYSKRPEVAGKPPIVLARQDFCDRFLAAGIYEEYQNWATSVISNHQVKVEATAPQKENITQVTVEVASRPTGTLVSRIKSYVSQGHVALLRKGLQNTINTALKASDVSWEEKIEAFQSILENPYFHDWAVEQAEFHGLEIVDGKVEMAF